MTLTITTSVPTTLPLEWPGLTPDQARDLPLSQIERFEIHHGNQALPLADIFQVRGKPEDQRWELDGEFSHVHGIGAGMTAGEIRISGSAGRHLGSRMRGGGIHVAGDAGDFLAAQMHAGLIHIHGNAGHFVGAAYRGSPRGMTGGTILIDGNAGDELGAAMRRGLIAVGGDSGDFVGHNLLAGTIVVCGRCGAHPGAGVRRGTLVLTAANRPALPRGYHFACVSHSPVLPLLFQKLKHHGFQSHTLPHCEIYNGDMLTGGRGEILLCRSA